jgi:hypothetical protein
MIEFLCSQRMLTYGWDYMIKMESSVKIKVGAKGQKEVELGKPTQVLYLQMTTAHKLYQIEHRKSSGQAGHKKDTITTYLENREYSIGMVSSMYRKDTHRSGNTSFHAFRYDDLQIQVDTLENADKDARIYSPNSEAAKMANPNEEDLPFKDEN